jgi:hypothetical protein
VIQNSTHSTSPTATIRRSRVMACTPSQAHPSPRHSRSWRWIRGGLVLRWSHRREEPLALTQSLLLNLRWGGSARGGRPYRAGRRDGEHANKQDASDSSRYLRLTWLIPRACSTLPASGSPIKARPRQFIVSEPMAAAAVELVREAGELMTRARITSALGNQPDELGRGCEAGDESGRSPGPGWRALSGAPGRRRSA